MSSQDASSSSYIRKTQGPRARKRAREALRWAEAFVVSATAHAEASVAHANAQVEVATSRYRALVHKQS
eukprot:16448823-Heterocapsa_arctica.AAC.1